MKLSTHFLSKTRFYSPALLMILASLMTGAGKSEFYDTNFETSKPPVYLSGILGEESELSKISVRGIVPDSPAARSGLRRGDEILSFEGQSLNRSARTLYQSLFHLYESQSPTLALQIRRKGEKQEITLQPDYDPSHVVLGIQYGFIEPDGQRTRSVQFVKREVSPEGVEHDAIYDFRDLIRVSTKCHWWGGKILVVEWDIFNDQKTSPLAIRIDQITVKDQKGNPLQALDPEAMTGLIYNKEAIWSVNEAGFHWKKKEAQQMLEEMQQLQEELTRFSMKDTDLPAKNRFYGVLYYSMSPVQPPVSISTKFGKEKFSSKFEFGQQIVSHSYPEPETAPEEKQEPTEGVPPEPTGDYDILL